MKILFLCHRFPFPPKGGAKIRAFYMIEHLSRSHDVTVASMVRSREEALEGQGLGEYCGQYIMERIRSGPAAFRMARGLLSHRPSSFGYFWSPSLARRVRQVLASNRFDLVVVHCSSMAPYVSAVTGPAKLLDFCDMDSQKWLEYGRFSRFPTSWGYYLEGAKLQLEEAALAQRFDVCTCATPAELKTLNGYNVQTQADWFPNGVDIERFSPGRERYDANTMSFIGRMDYYPNQQCMVDFCADTLPLIRARKPAVKLFIVGANPSREIRRLAEIEGVTVTGTVDRVQPYVHRSALTVAPLKLARGVQNKILESLAMGVPAVASPVASGGVDAIPGEHLLVARSPSEYAEAILRVLEDPLERDRLSLAGRRRMESNHTWEHSMKRLDTIIERCLAERRDARVSRPLSPVDNVSRHE